MEVLLPRPLQTLKILDVKHLCLQLGTSKRELDRITRAPAKYYRQRDICINEKIRHIATPCGRLRELLDRLLRLLQRISLPENIQGGRPGYSFFSNASRHFGKPCVLVKDLKDFFPSISHKRVYSIFVNRLGCAPDVAYYLTLMTTLNGSLPQGSPTSTALAVLAGENLSLRLNRLALQHRAESTQYVDDIAISGSAHVGKLTGVVSKIINQEGFRDHPKKTRVALGNNEKVITGVRVNSGPDVPSKKLREIRQLIDNLDSIRKSGANTSRQDIVSLRGKIRYVEMLNKGAGKFLRSRLEGVLL